MIPVPTGARVWHATGYTDMRRGFPSLALQVQEVLRKDPLSGHLFVFRGRRRQLVSLYVPLSDSRQADQPIVLIINVVFRPTFDHALHRYAH
ncbi:IS66 family insertion sequence element accessory protein TnpB [Bradyrhizobium pachyrhizi]|uniref:IS66 family insertion sequence element accessory protein TnpB n=1 Tax=Bradyrhizobium pachyrhizi TaxID=280333 RepID=UPI0012E35ACA